MDNCFVDIEINLFDKKDVIIKHFSDDDLEYETERRTIQKVFIDETDLEIEFNTDISKFKDEILEELDEDELICEIESRGYTVFRDEEVPDDVVCSKQGIAEFIGLKWYSTKEQILKELENIL